MKTTLLAALILLAGISCKEKKSQVVEAIAITPIDSSVINNVAEDIVDEDWKKNYAEENPLMVEKDESLDWYPAGSPAISHFSILSDTLIALQINDEDDDNPLNKYGYEFSGHCYDCLSIDILITPQTLTFTGGCRTDELREYTYAMIGKGANKYVVRMEDGLEFVFEKVEQTPIFQLSINGHIEKDEYAPYILKYYTTQKALAKFAIFDCGDYQG